MWGPEALATKGEGSRAVVADVVLAVALTGLALAAKGTDYFSYELCRATLSPSEFIPPLPVPWLICVLMTPSFLGFRAQEYELLVTLGPRIIDI